MMLTFSRKLLAAASFATVIAGALLIGLKLNPAAGTGRHRAYDLVNRDESQDARTTVESPTGSTVPERVPLSDVQSVGVPNGGKLAQLARKCKISNLGPLSGSGFAEAERAMQGLIKLHQDRLVSLSQSQDAARNAVDVALEAAQFADALAGVERTYALATALRTGKYWTITGRRFPDSTEAITYVYAFEVNDNGSRKGVLIPLPEEDYPDYHSALGVARRMRQQCQDVQVAEFNALPLEERRRQIEQSDLAKQEIRRIINVAGRHAPRESIQLDEYRARLLPSRWAIDRRTLTAR